MRGGGYEQHIHGRPRAPPGADGRGRPEPDNLRAALGWALVGPADEEQLGLRLAGALRWFWYHRGRFGEGRGWLATALGQPGAERRTPARARALHGAGVLAFYAGDPAAARSAFEESVAVHREVGDEHGLAHALVHLGVSVFRDDPAAARRHEEESGRLFASLGDRWGYAHARLYLGIVTDALDPPTARAAWEESRAIFAELGDSWSLGAVVANLGHLARRAGEIAAARRLLEESLAPFRAAGDRWRVGIGLESLGDFAGAAGDHAGAAELQRQALALYRALGDQGGVAACLIRLGRTAEAAGQPERAARLFGAADALGAAGDLRYRPITVALDPSVLEQARARFDAPALPTAWAEGRALTPEQAVAYAATAPAPEPAGTGPAAAVASTGPLSPREHEVAALVAQGLTNRRIAERLVLSVRTIDRHLENILRRLDLDGRTQLAAWALGRRTGVGNRDG